MKKSTWTKSSNKEYWAGMTLFNLIMMLVELKLTPGDEKMPDVQAFAKKHFKKV